MIGGALYQGQVGVASPGHEFVNDNLWAGDLMDLQLVPLTDRMRVTHVTLLHLRNARPAQVSEALQGQSTLEKGTDVESTFT